jgi:hypothetical protein
MQQILASAKAVNQILKGQRYSVDYYQRGSRSRPGSQSGGLSL